jgi:diadenosine tetraphosphate (Ap4A) HIT family hydrolase
MQCPFCDPPHNAILLGGEHCYALWDQYPVNPGHVLIIPFRHVETYFETTLEERQCISSLVDQARELVERQYAPDGYNIGVNVGRVAGQSVPHTHIHFIPRYRGDTKKVGEGIRKVVERREKSLGE